MQGQPARAQPHRRKAEGSGGKDFVENYLHHTSATVLQVLFMGCLLRCRESAGEYSYPVRVLPQTQKLHLISIILYFMSEFE